jgi:predicted AlkP superfamily pyrophosphatase or phosphodiesterase
MNQCPVLPCGVRRHGLLILAAIASLLAPALPAQQKTPLLLVISVDGLRPDYVTSADAHGSSIPNLRRFLTEGSYAEGVQGVVPTATYPSHTTLVTGVWPAKHGIFAKTTFDPLQKDHQGWYWYAEDIRVPTLWDAAKEAGRTTASIQWPVTAGAHGELPDLPELRAAFFVIGPGVPARRSLGVMDMREVAPTLAHLAGLSLPTAEGKNVLP